MAQILVRNLEQDVRNKLQGLARSHGRSMEEEVRHILRSAVAAPAKKANLKLGSRIARRFAGIGCDQGFEELRGHPAQAARLER
jgi:plasmid stability protein